MEEERKGSEHTWEQPNTSIRTCTGPPSFVDHFDLINILSFCKAELVVFSCLRHQSAPINERVRENYLIVIQNHSSETPQRWSCRGRRLFFDSQSLELGKR